MVPKRNVILDKLGNMFFDSSTCEGYKNLLQKTAITLCEDVFENASNYWFTDHGPKHSDAVLHHAIELAYNAQRHVKKFNEQEIFGLVCACYLHDIGMAHIPNHFDLENGYSKELIDEIRVWHVEAVDILLPMKHNELKKIYREFALLQTGLPLVCRAHGTKEHNGTCEEFTNRRAEFPDFRGDLLGKILLMADELDLDHRRSNFDHPHADKFPVDSKAHMYKHYYVCNVELNGPRLEIVYSFPSEMQKSERDIFMRWNSSKLKRQIKLVQKYLSSDVQNIFDLTIIPPISTSVQGKRIAPADICAMAEKFAGKKEVKEKREKLRDCPNFFDPNHSKPKEEGALSPAMNDLMDDLFRTLDTELARKFFDKLYVEIDQNKIAQEKLLEAVKDYESRIRRQYRNVEEVAVPLQPFLITGRTGCGKSALLRNAMNKGGQLLQTKLPTHNVGGHLVILIDCRRFKTFEEILEQLLLMVVRECRRSKTIIWPSLQKAQWAQHLTEENISSMDEKDKLSKLRGVLRHLHKELSITLKRAAPVIFILDNIDRIPRLELRKTVVNFVLREATSGYPFFVVPLRNTTKNLIDKSYDDFDKIATHSIRSPSHRELLSTRLSTAFSEGLLNDSKSWSRKQKVVTTLNACGLEFKDLRKVCWEVMTSLVDGKFIVKMSGSNMRDALTIFRAIMKSLPMHLILIFRSGNDQQKRTHELIRILALEGHPCYFEDRSKIRSVFSSIYGYSIFTQFCLYTILQYLTAIPDQYASLNNFIARAVKIGLPKQEVEKQIMEMVRSHFPFVEVEGYEDGLPEEYRFVDVLGGSRIRLSTAGLYYFEWLAYDITYLDCVLQDTIMDTEIAQELARLRTQTPQKLEGSFERVDIFLNYLESQESIERATWDCSRIPKLVPKIRKRIEFQRKGLIRKPPTL